MGFILKRLQAHPDVEQKIICLIQCEQFTLNGKGDEYINNKHK